MMDGVAITVNQWNKLKYVNVSGVPSIYLLYISVSKWPSNCEIGWIGYTDNKIKRVVVKVMSCRLTIK